VSQIAFHTNYGAVQVISADGTGLRTVTSGPNDEVPAWSPDGTRLVFQSDRSQQNDWDIYAVNWDGSGLTRLTSGPEADQEPAWSPDGTRIAFVRNGLLHLMNADGSGVTRLSNTGEDSHPTWGADTGRIVFLSSRSGTKAIYVMHTDGSGVVQLTSPLDHDEWPAWSPDGRMIAFQRGTDSSGVIHVINADGTGARQVTSGHRPAWSPDGRMLVYDVFAMTIANLDGSGMRSFGGGRGSPAWTRVGTMPLASVPFRSIEKAGGDRQSGRVGATLAEPLTVRVVRDDGTPESGATIRWNVVPQGTLPASLSAGVTVTDSSGTASVRVTLGGTPTEVWVRAALADGTARTGEVVFKATAVP
jgi:dipeptidyl aminopeptidase/acylaminoacyl peptidase